MIKTEQVLDKFIYIDSSNSSFSINKENLYNIRYSNNYDIMYIAILLGINDLIWPSC